MKERQLICNAREVRAIQSGAMTQFRRILKPQPAPYVEFVREHAPEVYGPGALCAFREDGKTHQRMAPCHYGQPGDRLWVREAFMPCPLENPTTGPSRWNIAYASDAEQVERQAPAGYNPMLYNYERWTPSIHMPRWASRLTLEITSVRVERLQAISEADAWAEGCMRGDPNDAGGWFPADEPDPSGIGERGWDCARDWFADLWESINGPGSWDANPWVCVVEFRRIGQ